MCECGCGQSTTIARQSDTRKGHVNGQPKRFRPGHWARTSAEPLAAKYVVDTATGCWVWQRAMVEGYGYYKPPGASQNVRAHRYVYEQLVGPIPDGMTLDHLCRNRACINPAHLEVVTSVENTRRAKLLVTHCKRGHSLSGKNVYIHSGRRHCRACRSLRKRRLVA